MLERSQLNQASRNNTPPKPDPSRSTPKTYRISQPSRMCLSIQPVCNSCFRHAKTEELVPCSETRCTSANIEVVPRPLTHTELINTQCNNPDCGLNPTVIEHYISSVRKKVSSMQQVGRQRSLMNSRWAPGNIGSQQSNSIMLQQQQQQQQQQTTSIFDSARQFCGSVGSVPSFPSDSNVSAGSYASVLIPPGSGNVAAGVASQVNSNWSRKVTVTFEESGSTSSCSGAFVNFNRGR
ncbi:hypothetical protein VM1G_07531 [Cytospora mali]|uniref:Uncharacterized protein n=1 Tax=Cytospora mali TaxID=578113 RepID=A0A194W715_CYTMA|nr:hypothetical protein VM1G_07531 [Valsa mali]